MKFDTYGTGKINLIFLHGWGADKNSFLWMKDYLSDCRLHFASLDGFGGTPPPTDSTICGYAERLKEYISQNNLTNVVLLGHSFGGRIAIEFASKNSLAGLVLVDSAGIKPKFNLKKQFKIFKFKICKRLVKLKLMNRERLNVFGSSDYQNCSPEMKKVFFNAIHYNQTGQLKNIDVPTQIIWGDCDIDTPLYMAKILEKKISHSKLNIIEGGHFCFLENKFQFYSIVKDFLKRIRGEENE
ncbi:MAG: alpha/beta hydrolase [Clostridia bacterium]|nr:alpha/beta hydrolase [Clostridia bacterium]